MAHTIKTGAALAAVHGRIDRHIADHIRIGDCIGDGRVWDAKHSLLKRTVRLVALARHATPAALAEWVAL